ncbi:MAG TPA: hypothetical protein VFA35_08375 [Burkholderiaceae bacterium]|nr:hypothetical protein [Burkholderiaceae bacterium]
MAFDLGSLLQQYLGGAAAPNQQQAEAHFDQAAQNAPTDVLSSALSAMFRSDQTPAFGQMAGQLFGQANPNQQAGMLNSLIASMGPAVLASLLNKGGAGGGGALGSLLGQLTGSGAAPQLTPAQASQVSPEQVQVIADAAEKSNPSIVDQMSAFYAEHPTLVKTVGGAALSIALAKLAEHARA